MKLIKKLMRNWKIDSRINDLILQELASKVTEDFEKMEAAMRAIKRMEKLKF